MRVRASSCRPPATAAVSVAGTLASNHTLGLGSVRISPSARGSACGSARWRHRACCANCSSACGQFAGCGGGGLFRVAVEAAFTFVLRQAQQQFTRQFTGRRRAKADRAGHAIAAHRRAVVAPARRQVEHVAGLQHPGLCGLEVAQQLQRRTGHPGRLTAPGRRRDAPLTPALHLQQKHVVGIDMRARHRRRGWPTRPSGRPGVRRAKNESAPASGARRAGAGPGPAPAASSPGAPPAAARGAAAGPGAPSRRVAAAPVRCTRRDSTPSLRGHLEQRRRASAARATPGQAWRTSSGFFCQWRRMKAAGLRPPSSGVAAFTSIAAFWPRRAAGPGGAGRVRSSRAC